MDITLEKIDTIRERTGVSYKEAKDILEKHNGDVIEALIDLEQNQTSWGENIGQNIMNTTDAVMEKLKEMLKKGNVTKIIIKKNGNIIMNIPVTAGAIGAILSPPITAIGLTTALLSKCTIEIVKQDGEVVNMNEMAEKTMNKMKNTVKKESVMNTEDDAEDITDEDFEQ